MALHESIRGLVSGRGIRRRPLVGIDFVQEGARARRMAMSPSSFQARDLFSLLLRHFAARATTPEPVCRITLNATSPSGRASVRIIGKKRAVTVSEAPARIQQRG